MLLRHSAAQDELKACPADMTLTLFSSKHSNTKKNKVVGRWKINFMIIQFIFIKNLNKKIEIMFTKQFSSKLL